MKIFDCFPFFNELNLLDLRLKYLSDRIDKFIIVEGTHSHQGREKKLYFDENKSQFKKYNNKIIHIIRDNYPKHLGDTHSDFILDYYTRNGIDEGIKMCDDHDLIMISDIDEFPKKNLITDPKKFINIFNMVMIYFKFNIRVRNFDYENSDGYWPGTKILRYLTYKKYNEAQRIRNIKARVYGWWRFDKPKVKIIDNAGWHFRFLGDADQLFEELKNRSIGRTEIKLRSYDKNYINKIIKEKLPFTLNETYEMYPEQLLPQVVKDYKLTHPDFFESESI